MRSQVHAQTLRNPSFKHLLDSEEEEWGGRLTHRSTINFTAWISLHFPSSDFSKGTSEHHSHHTKYFLFMVI